MSEKKTQPSRKKKATVSQLNVPPKPDYKEKRNHIMSTIMGSLMTDIDDKWKEIENMMGDLKGTKYQLTQLDISHAFFAALMANMTHMGDEEDVFIASQMGVRFAMGFLDHVAEHHGGWGDDPDTKH